MGGDHGVTATDHGERNLRRWIDRRPLALSVAVGLVALLRPDGHVAWVGDDQTDLLSQLPRWFGAPARRSLGGEGVGEVGEGGAVGG